MKLSKKKEGTKFAVFGCATNYKEFLKVGSTKNPIDSLKIAGVDLNKKEVIESAIKMFDETINEFSLIKKRK